MKSINPKANSLYHDYAVRKISKKSKLFFVGTREEKHGNYYRTRKGAEKYLQYVLKANGVSDWQ